MSSKILINPEALSQSYFPEKLLYREKEVEQLTQVTGLANTYAHGQTGIGKTTLVKHVIKTYNATQRDKAIYINCSLYQTTNAIFHEILAALNRMVVSKSNYELTKRLRARLRQIDFRLTICLDHFEHLKDVDVVNKIMSLGLTVLIVADNSDTYNRLNPQDKSQVANIVQIPSYAVDQAFDILKDRAEQALEKYTYSDDTLKKVAQVSQGNMTLALMLLKSLALKAETNEKSSLDDVELNYEVNNPNHKLNQDEKILLNILEEWQSLPSSRLYDFYREKARHPKSDRAFRNYMESLCVKGLVKAIGEKRGRIFEIVDENV